MVLLIDGYNVLHALQRLQARGQMTREAFVALVITYARALGHEATLVFDGGGSPHPHTTATGTIHVIESGYRQSADDLICRSLAEHAPESLLVISSDRAITAEAARHGIVSVDADAFAERLVEIACRPGRATAPAGRRQAGQRAQKLVSDGRETALDEHALDELMQQACVRVPVKKVDLEVDASPSKKGHKKSKAQRRLERLVKKL